MKKKIYDEEKKQKWLEECEKIDKYRENHPIPETDIDRDELSIFKFLEGKSIWNKEMQKKETQKIQFNLEAKPYFSKNFGNKGI